MPLKSPLNARDSFQMVVFMVLQGEKKPNWGLKTEARRTSGPCGRKAYGVEHCRSTI